MSDDIMKKLDIIENGLEERSKKALEEIKNLGKVSDDTKKELENIGLMQKEQADRLLRLEQKSGAMKDTPESGTSWGEEFVKSAQFKSYQAGDARGTVAVQIKQAPVSNQTGYTYSQRLPGTVEGAFRALTIEELLIDMTTTQNAVDWIQETAFVNAAAETGEGNGALPASSITLAPKTSNMVTIGHFIKITKQLAMDNDALAAYINRRMIYGVDLKVEQQLIAGPGTNSTMSGLTAAGNFVPHGYTAAGLDGLGLDHTRRFDLIGKMIGDVCLSDYMPDAIILNTGDWWTIRLTKDGQNRYLIGDPGSAAPAQLWGIPVAVSNSMVPGSVWVGSLKQAATFWKRQETVIEMSNNVNDDFISNLYTIKADRRAALAVEKPAASRYGLLVPA